MSTLSKDFKVKNGLQVTEGGTFGAPVSVGSPTGPDHATTKDYVDSIILVTGPAGNYIVSATPPSSPVNGDAWFNSEAAAMFVYYDSFWIEVTGAAGATGPTGPEGPTGPAGTSTGGSESLNLFLLMGA